MRTKMKRWTDAEIARLMHIYREATKETTYGCWSKIAAQMPGRTLSQCQSKVAYYLNGKRYQANNYVKDATNHPHNSVTIRAPQEVLADAEHRRRLSRPTLTAEFFGDPLPGYSALDRRG